MKRQLSLIVVVPVFLVLAGCSTMMNVHVIDSKGRNVNGAVVTVDDENIGKTPNASIDVSDFVGSGPIIRVYKDGYVTAQTSARREVKVGPLIGGLFLLIPFLWVYGPREDQSIMLVPEEAEK